MDDNARNGILMGIWVGSGHDSAAEIAAASIVLNAMDAAESDTCTEKEFDWESGTDLEGSSGWDDDF